MVTEVAPDQLVCYGHKEVLDRPGRLYQKQQQIESGGKTPMHLPGGFLQCSQRLPTLPLCTAQEKFPALVGLLHGLRLRQRRLDCGGHLAASRLTVPSVYSVIPGGSTLACATYSILGIPYIIQMAWESNSLRPDVADMPSIKYKIAFFTSARIYLCCVIGSNNVLGEGVGVPVLATAALPWVGWPSRVPVFAR